MLNNTFNHPVKYLDSPDKVEFTLRKNYKQLKLLSGSLFCNQLLSILAPVILSIIVIHELPQQVIYYALFFPLQYWFIAVSESLKATAMNLTIVALKPTMPWILGLIGAGFLLLPLILLHQFPKLLSNILGIELIPYLKIFLPYCQTMFFAQCLILFFVIFNSFLSALHQQHAALVLNGITIIINISACAYSMVYSQNGIWTIPQITSYIYSIGCLAEFLYLNCATQFSNHYSRANYNIQSVKLTFGVPQLIHDVYLTIRTIIYIALPIFLTYCILIVGNLTISHFFQEFGQQVNSAYWIMLRIQTLLLLPAISIGQALGILHNQGIRFFASLLDHSILLSIKVTLRLIIALYLISIVIAVSQYSSQNIINHVRQLLNIMGFSYIGLAIFLLFCLFSDVTGKGIYSLFANFFSYLLIMVSVKISLHFSCSINTLCYTLSFCNLLMGCITHYLLKIMVRRNDD